jgi:hypothetical protein
VGGGGGLVELWGVVWDVIGWVTKVREVSLGEGGVGL